MGAFGRNLCSHICLFRLAAGTFSHGEGWKLMKGWRGRWGGGEKSSGLVVNTFWRDRDGIAFMRTKEGRREDGSHVSVESPESCWFGGFRLWFLSSLPSLSPPVLTLLFGSVSPEKEKWQSLAHSPALSPHFFLLSNISISLLNTSLLSFHCHFSHLQHHFLPLSPLFPYLLFHFLCLSSRLEIPPTRCLFIANSSS